MLAPCQLYILYNVSFTLTFPLFISYRELPSETTYPGSASPASVTRNANFFFPPCNGQLRPNVSLRNHPRPHSFPAPHCSSPVDQWLLHSTPRIYRVKLYREDPSSWNETEPTSDLRDLRSHLCIFLPLLKTSFRRAVPSKYKHPGIFKAS